MNPKKPDTTTAHRDTPEQRLLRLRTNKALSNTLILFGAISCAPTLVLGAMVVGWVVKVGLAANIGTLPARFVVNVGSMLLLKPLLWLAILWFESKRRSLPAWWPRWLTARPRPIRTVPRWHVQHLYSLAVGFALLVTVAIAWLNIAPWVVPTVVACGLGFAAFFASLFWRWGDTLYCAQCGYEQTDDAPERCPECGSDWHDVRGGARMGRRRFKPSLFLVGLVLILGAVGVAIIAGRNGP